jgi:flagellar motor switch protein FliG
MLADGDLKTLLQHVDTSCWAPALKSAPLPVQQAVFHNMNPKPAELLGREMSQLGDLDPSIEHDARSQIINGLVKLQREGSIGRIQKSPPAFRRE